MDLEELFPASAHHPFPTVCVGPAAVFLNLQSLDSHRAWAMYLGCDFDGASWSREALFVGVSYELQVALPRREKSFFALSNQVYKGGARSGPVAPGDLGPGYTVGEEPFATGGSCRLTGLWSGR